LIDYPTNDYDADLYEDIEYEGFAQTHSDQFGPKSANIWICRHEIIDI